jgi:hypothetical protein
MKAMLIGMLLTTYKVMFQRLPTKAACAERTLRFKDIFKNYRRWFVESKCIPTDAFTKSYEELMQEKEIKPDQFNGMPEGTYTVHDKRGEQDIDWQDGAPAMSVARANDDPLKKMLALPVRQAADPTGEIQRLKDLVESHKDDQRVLEDQLAEHKTELEAHKDKMLAQQKAQVEADREKRVNEFFRDKEKIEPEDFAGYVETAGDFSPGAKSWAILHSDRFTRQGARWGDDPEPKDLDFATRLAKLQDW